ncbi:hypothetical protein D3C80_1349500 [compost metagenome]
MPQPLQANMQPCGIHHHEHRSQAAMGLAYQPAPGPLQAQCAGGAATDAQLMFQAVAVQCIALAILQPFRHQQQREPAVAGRRIRQPGQHQVEYVAGQVVFAARDEQLVATDRVATVTQGHGAAAQQA